MKIQKDYQFFCAITKIKFEYRIMHRIAERLDYLII